MKKREKKYVRKAERSKMKKEKARREIKTEDNLPGGLPDEYQAFLYGFTTEIHYGIPREEEVKLKTAKRKIQKVKSKKRDY